MSYEFYKILHICGLLLTFSSLAAGLFPQFAGAALQGSTRKFAFIGHGLGILLLLVSGFGLAARLQYFGSLPTWIYVKLAIWLYFGGAIVLVKRKYQWGWKLMSVFIVLGGVAASIAITKPF